MRINISLNIFACYLFFFSSISMATSPQGDAISLEKVIMIHQEVENSLKSKSVMCDEESMDNCVHSYDQELIRLGFTKKSVTANLQNMYQSEHDKSFSNIGKWEDLFHAHFLYSKIDGKEKVVALLFHTQENWKAPGRPIEDIQKAKFITKDRRNIIQWIEGPKKGLIENGIQYDNKSLQASWYSKYRDVGTVTPDMIDETSFGFKLLYKDYQADPYKIVTPPAAGIQFFQIQCASLGSINLDSTSIIKLRGTKGEEICLNISRTFCGQDNPKEQRPANCPKDCALKLDKKDFLIFGSINK